MPHTSSACLTPTRGMTSSIIRSEPARHSLLRRQEQLARNALFTGLYDRVIARFDAYMQSRVPSAWFPAHYPQSDLLVAYFCCEYGVHESFPMYSGGLGVLAGDHVKSASDLGLPLVAVGLWYTQGYFRQIIDDTGQQVAAPDDLGQPMRPCSARGPRAPTSSWLSPAPVASCTRASGACRSVACRSTSWTRISPPIRPPTGPSAPACTAATRRPESPRKWSWASVVCAPCAPWAWHPPAGT